MPQHRKVWNSNPILEVYHVSLETKRHLAIFDPYATGCWGLRTKNHTLLSTLFHSVLKIIWDQGYVWKFIHRRNYTNKKWADFFLIFKISEVFIK